MSIDSYFREIYSDIFPEMCTGNCSGHGDCLNGTCFCEIKFAGIECGGMNTYYFVGLAVIYFVVALVSFVQLLTAITVSCRNSVSKGHFLKEALSPTTPKALYAIVFLASSLRAAYFAVSATWAANWLLSLLTAYYPLLLTGSSLIVCFWAERFHLRNVCFESHRFLSKSFLGFLAFNVLTYSILLVQLLLVVANNNETERGYYLNIFNGCYAVLLLVVVIFFLIYGVEVYFKVRGGFLLLSPSRQLQQDPTCNKKKGDTLSLVSGNQAWWHCFHFVLCHVVAYCSLFGVGLRWLEVDNSQPVDISQLNQSRLGLVSQASMILITILFILSDILGEFWKNKVDVEKRNYHDIIFRAVEVGCVLWFPCVLWNVSRPDQLWILNPKKLLKVSEVEEVGSINTIISDDSTQSGELSCFICRDPSNDTVMGPYIYPCDCRGDVATPHHDCLRNWLQELASRGSPLTCSVCKSPYKLESRFRWSSCSDVSASNWLKLSLMVVVIAGIVLCTWAACHILPLAAYKVMVVGFAIGAIYVIFKFLSRSTFAAYHQARVSSVKIVSRNPGELSQPTGETESNL